MLVVVALHHGSQFRLLPGVWCVRAYQSLPRTFRKHVKHVILLQPSMLVKAAVTLLYPFVSSKAHAKVKQVGVVVLHLPSSTAAACECAQQTSSHAAADARRAAHQAFRQRRSLQGTCERAVRVRLLSACVQVQRLLDIDAATRGEVQVPHLGEAFLTTIHAINSSRTQAADSSA